MAKEPFIRQSEKEIKLLEIVHSDVCGPWQCILNIGKPTFVTFTDDLNRYDYIFLLKYKFEGFDKFKKFKY